MILSHFELSLHFTSTHCLSIQSLDNEITGSRLLVKIFDVKILGDVGDAYITQNLYMNTATLSAGADDCQTNPAGLAHVPSP